MYFSCNYGIRNFYNPPISDIPYIKNMIEESIERENRLLITYKKMLNKSKKTDIKDVYDSLIVNTAKNIRLLQIIYTNLFGKTYELNNIKEYDDNVKSVILENIELSKILRKILYGVTNNTHRLMLFDIIIDNTNNMFLLNIVE